MKKVIRGAAIICLLLPLTACRFRYMNPEDVSGFLENLSGIVGSFQITSDHDLIGERGCGEDAYTGRYWAECEGNTGKDVIFGGASLEGRKLYVSGHVNARSGKAVIRISMNGDVTELEPDEDGYFSTELKLDSGGNYIMVRYENYIGTVELTSKVKAP